MSRDVSDAMEICLFTNIERRRSHPVLQCPVRDAITCEVSDFLLEADD